jgi:catechol 2,3-dioxygenase-like lactoylglutathione lyase family enzyme
MGVWSFQLVFDCGDPTRLCDFWHRALRYGPGAWLDDHREFLEQHPEILGRQGVCQHAEFRLPRLYIQKVPEPKAGPNRIRPEISLPASTFAEEVERLSALGAERIDDFLLLDPEGNEMLLVPGDEHPQITAIEIDANDPASQEAFWSAALGDAFAAFPPAPSPRLRFVATGEPKRHKNRLHLDLNVTDGNDSLQERKRLVELGARVLRPEENGNPLEEWSDHGCVMRDPEGNEFCLQATKR